MSLLTIIQDAARHPSLTLPVPSSVVGNAQSSTPALLMAAKEELDSLATRANWTKLTREHTFTTTATAVQLTASALPTDFDRMINETMFNRTTRRKFWGPLTPEQWQHTQSSLTTLVDPAYRIRGTTILIHPVPATANTIAYEYISKYKVLSSGGTDQENWQADSDTCRFPEAIVTMGVVWRYRKGKGYPFSNELEEYERRVVELIMRDGTRGRITTDPISNRSDPIAPQVPETLVF